jgi:hypothetical protein
VKLYVTLETTELISIRTAFGLEGAGGHGGVY